MDKLVYSCRDVRTWLLNDLSAGLDKPIPSQIVDHIRTCLLCRGALYQMVVVQLQLGDIDDISCETCQDLLAEFVTAERRDALAAIKQYPSVWKHLLTCADCADTYETVQVVLDDEPELLEPVDWMPATAPPLPAGPPISLPSPFELLLSMPRDSLVGLPTPAEFSSIRRSTPQDAEAEEFLLRPTAAYEAHGLKGELRAAYHPAAGAWSLTVTFNAPAYGRVQARVGAYVNTIDVHGDTRVVFSNIPTADLISDETSLLLGIAAVAA